MADIFISYASEDRVRAEAVAGALRAQGWTVWWDEHIAPGKRFDSVIEAELNQARCVVVLWSRASVESEWVREEAHEGKKRALLVPALIAEVEPPFGYRTVQAANLVDWAPGGTHREFDTLLASIEALAPRPKAAPAPSPAAQPARPVQPLRERSWQRLLDRVRDGTVVPVVGQRLLLGADGRSSLMAEVAAGLLAEREVDLPAGGLAPFRELDEALGLLQRHKGPDALLDLHFDVHLALQALRKRPGFALPRALTQLAQIRDFSLMVTLTPDDLLARALQAEGRALNEVVHSPRLPTVETSDLPHDWAAPGGAVQLLYAFGKTRTTPQFAIGEGELERYLDNLQGRDTWVPREFLNALRDRSLLFLGASYADWLTRRVMRTLGAPRDGGMSLPGVAHQPGVLLLDPSYGVALEWDGPPAEFVAELHRRWLAEPAAPASPAPAPPAAAGAAPAGFYISHARGTDLAAARQLRDALLALGVAPSEIGLDEAAMQPAERSREQLFDLMRGYRHCLVLVSQAAVARADDALAQEWDAATVHFARRDGGFLCPIVVDPDFRPEAYRHPALEFWRGRGFGFGHAPGGRPDEALMLRLQLLVIESRARDDEP